jgi:short-subunit dehydrogenase
VYHGPVSDPKRTALVTGASAGIGTAFARLLAADGFDLVLVARRRERLEEIAKELHEKHGVEAVALAVDLARPEAPTEIREELERRGIPVDVLVNNAGYGLKKGFGEAAWQEHADFLQVMATSVTELCHVFLPHMKQRGWGRIINVASVAAFSPQVAGNLYGGVKRYVVDFSQALALELEGSGVHVSALCPGYTLTEFHDVMDVRSDIDALPGFMVMGADVVARQGWEAVERGTAVYIPGRLYRLIVTVLRLTPPALLRGLARRSVLRPKR